jgi:hypothetical protein
VPQLLNRSAERTALEELLEDLRSGRGRALVVRGEAGVGKSALLEHALGAAGDMRVLRTVGVESEMELAFAGVHLLYAPLLDGVKRLPGPQRDALGVAFGLQEGAAPDRGLVGNTDPAGLRIGHLQHDQPLRRKRCHPGRRTGALTYTTGPFAQSKAIAGPIDATVYLSSTTVDSELAATVEAVSPSGVSKPFTSGALLGSMRALDPSETWMGSDGIPLLPVHPLTGASQELPGHVTEEDIQIFPTFGVIPAGWRLRVTFTTGDTPHIVPTVMQLPRLVGGIYQIERNASAASVLNVPLAPLSSFWVPCGSLCSLDEPSGT